MIKISLTINICTLKWLICALQKPQNIYLNYVVVVTSCFYRQMINYDDVGSFDGTVKSCFLKICEVDFNWHQSFAGVKCCIMRENLINRCSFSARCTSAIVIRKTILHILHTFKIDMCNSSLIILSKCFSMLKDKLSEGD